MSLDNYTFDFFSEEVNFTIKYLSLSNNESTFTNRTFRNNGFNKSIYRIVDDNNLFFNSYVDVVSKSDKHIKLKLNKKGQELSKLIRTNKTVKLDKLINRVAYSIRLFFTPFIVFFSRFLDVILFPILFISKMIFSKNTAETIKLMSALFGMIWVIIKLIEYLENHCKIN